MVERDVVIRNRAGIQARPAAMLAKVANGFTSRIFLERDGERINAKSIMGIITLGATYDTTLKVIAEGPDENEAVEAVARLFESKFAEE